MPKSSFRNTFLAGPNNASAKWGFDSPSGSNITSAPKLQGQFFVKFFSGHVENEVYSSKVKSLSEISLNVESMTTDQYGKRIYTPTRVDFSPVTLTMYDTVDGGTIKMARQIYENYFKNNSLSTDPGSIDATIADVNSGKKLGPEVAQQNHFFTKIEIYHFFGQGSGGDGETYAQFRANGEYNYTEATALMQKITLVNPLVTSITFDQHDYAPSEIKTVVFTLQPENIIITDGDVSTVSPEWMTKGMDAIEQVLLSAGITKYDRFDYEGIKKLFGGSVDNLLRIDQDLTALGITSSSDPEQLQSYTDKVNAYLRGAGAPDDSPISNTVKYGTVPSFGNLVSNTPGFGNYGADNILDTFQNELINSVFNGTKFSLKNIGQNALQGFLGNKGLSDIYSLNRTATSKYGFVGDYIRDSIRGSVLGDNRASATGTIIPPMDVATQGNNFSVSEFSQSSANNTVAQPPGYTGKVVSADRLGVPQDILQGDIRSQAEVGKVKEIIKKK